MPIDKDKHFHHHCTGHLKIRFCEYLWQIICIIIYYEFNGKIIFFFFQRNCIEFALNAKPVRRYIPKNPIQYKLWAFVTSPVFEYTIFVMILINTLSLAMKFYKQPLLYTQFLDVLNVIFTVFFTMEFVFKLGAFRFKVCMGFSGHFNLDLSFIIFLVCFI